MSGTAVGRLAMLLCAECGRKIDADEVKYRVTIDGKSVTICAEDAKKRGI